MVVFWVYGVRAIAAFDAGELERALKWCVQCYNENLTYTEQITFDDWEVVYDNDAITKYISENCDA